MFNTMYQDNLYKYLGLAVVVILIIYVLVKTLTFQRGVVENFSTDIFNISDSTTGDSTKTKSTTTKTDDNKESDFEKIVKLQRALFKENILNDDNRTHVENDLIMLEELSNYMLLDKIIRIVNNISFEGAEEKSIKIDKYMLEANNLKSFIDTLNVGMKFIDRK